MKNKFVFITAVLALLCSMFLFVGCDETQGGGNEPETLALANGTFDEDNSATITVSEYTEIFSFTDNIIINSNYSYKVYLEEDCEEKSVINSNYDALSYGKNNYYIKATNKTDNTTSNYSLCVIREKYLTVTFVFGDDTPNETITVLYGEMYTPPEKAPAPIKGHECKGWNYSALPVTEDMTVGGVYEMIAYTCTFDYNYDTPDTTRTAYYDIYLPLETPTRTGYEFIGWFYNGEKVEHPFRYMFEENITLVAEWEEVTH